MNFHVQNVSPVTIPKRIRNGLAPLVAPHHLRGRMTKWTPQEVRDERTRWAVEQGRKGYSSGDVGAALGIAQRNAWRVMVLGGWDAWVEQRARAAV